MGRKNCWEILKCQKESACPAYPNHGRDCFAVTATMCRGEIQGSYDEKISKCREGCHFYQGVMTGGV